MGRQRPGRLHERRSRHGQRTASTSGPHRAKCAADRFAPFSATPRPPRVQSPPAARGRARPGRNRPAHRRRRTGRGGKDLGLARWAAAMDPRPTGSSPSPEDRPWPSPSPARRRRREGTAAPSATTVRERPPAPALRDGPAGALVIDDAHHLGPDRWALLDDVVTAAPDRVRMVLATRRDTPLPTVASSWGVPDRPAGDVLRFDDDEAALLVAAHAPDASAEDTAPSRPRRTAGPPHSSSAPAASPRHPTGRRLARAVTHRPARPRLPARRGLRNDARAPRSRAPVHRRRAGRHAAAARSSSPATPQAPTTSPRHRRRGHPGHRLRQSGGRRLVLPPVAARAAPAAGSPDPTARWPSPRTRGPPTTTPCTGRSTRRSGTRSRRRPRRFCATLLVERGLTLATSGPRGPGGRGPPGTAGRRDGGPPCPARRHRVAPAQHR